jgi:hypothetical protein
MIAILLLDLQTNKCIALPITIKSNHIISYTPTPFVCTGRRMTDATNQKTTKWLAYYKCQVNLICLFYFQCIMQSSGERLEVLNSEKVPFHLLHIKKLLLKPWFFFDFTTDRKYSKLLNDLLIISALNPTCLVRSALNPTCLLQVSDFSTHLFICRKVLFSMYYVIFRWATGVLNSEKMPFHLLHTRKWCELGKDGESNTFISLEVQ